MDSRTTVAKNAFYVFLVQVFTSAVSFATVPLLTRTLGSSDYGRWWVAVSIASLAGLAIDFGLEGYVSIAAARQRTRAAELVGTSAMLRVGLALAGAIPLELILRLLNYEAQMRTIVFLLYAANLVSQIGTGAMAVLRGLERMGWPAAARLGTDCFDAVLLVGALWLGTGLAGVVAVQILASVAGLLLSVYLVRRARLWPPRFVPGATRELLLGGAPFLLWGGVLALQTGLESMLLSKLASNDVAGWYGASSKLIGFLAFPVAILATAYSPTLARLQFNDEEGFRRTSLEALRAGMLIVAPVAVGTYLFAEQGVRLVYGEKFAPAADNLRVMSAFLLLAGINVLLGTVLIVSRRQFPWALAKAAMVVIGAAACYVLIPYFQARTGNGGIGAAAVLVGSEVGMLIAALVLLPRRLLGGSTFRDLARALVASGAMVLIARALSSAPFLVAMAAALVAYAAALFALGGISTREFTVLRDAVRSAMGGA